MTSEKPRDHDKLSDEEQGGEAACWAHMLNEEGRLIEPARESNVGMRRSDASSAYKREQAAE